MNIMGTNPFKTSSFFNSIEFSFSVLFLFRVPPRPRCPPRRPYTNQPAPGCMVHEGVCGRKLHIQEGPLRQPVTLKVLLLPVLETTLHSVTFCWFDLIYIWNQILAGAQILSQLTLSSGVRQPKCFQGSHVGVAQTAIPACLDARSVKCCISAL